MTENHRFGFAALVGAPNVGKSTLLNQVVGQKISIVSQRPQTTRHRILGIKTTPDYQMVFVDTPGLHENQPRTLNRIINRTAIIGMSDVDIILFMIDHRGWSRDVNQIFAHVKSRSIPVILIINKIDKVRDKSHLLPIIEESRKIYDFKEIVPLSALRFTDKDRFLALVSEYLPDGSCCFPEQQITDRSDRFMASEFIREQTFLKLRQELPYSIATEVTRFEVNDRDILCIDAVIWVEKQGQKSIIIGKQGKQLKQIGTQARLQMERTFRRKVFLNLWTRVRKGWANQEAMLRSLGYCSYS